MEEVSRFQAWAGRWQQQDAEWRSTAQDGDWRLRPIGENELDSYSEPCRPALLALDKDRTGLPYVLTIRIRREVVTRVPLFPIEGVFCTTAFYLSPKGKPDLRVVIKTEELPDVAAKVFKFFSGVADLSNSTLIGLACAVCRGSYVTGDPLIRYHSRRAKEPLSAHMLCAVVKATGILGHIVGTAVFVDPDDRLSMTNERVAILERAQRCVDGPPVSDLSMTVMAEMRAELETLCREIRSKTPYLDGEPAPKTSRESRATVMRFFGSLMELDRQAPAQSETKVGRNEACPCGSEKKYKHCCGSPK